MQTNVDRGGFFRINRLERTLFPRLSMSIYILFLLKGNEPSRSGWLVVIFRKDSHDLLARDLALIFLFGCKRIFRNYCRVDRNFLLSCDSCVDDIHCRSAILDDAETLFVARVLFIAILGMARLHAFQELLRVANL